MKAQVSRSAALLDAALAYAKLGWRVLPVHSVRNGQCSCGQSPCHDGAGKHPHMKAWQENATADEATIRQWWSTWPDANIGILAGGSGLVVIDVDPRHGGQDTLERWTDQHGPLPQTVEVHTGGGGRHYHFLHPGNGVKIKNDSGKVLGPGVDIKADGGYVLAPPSNHVSGNQYLFEVSADPGAVAVAPLPSWLFALLQRHSAPSTARPLDETEPIPKGCRHNTLVSLAGTMRHRGLRATEMLPTLLAVNEQRCLPPLAQEEVRTIAETARWSPAAPLVARANGEMPGARVIPFPVEALPEPLQLFAKETARALPVPVEFVALPALAAISSAIGGHARIQLKPGWLEPAALYLAIVSPTGTLKSPALSTALEPVRRCQDRYAELYKQEKDAFEQSVAEYQKASSEYRSGQRIEPPSKPPPPTRRRTWTSDATSERLAGLLAENPGGLLLVRDELTAWVKGMNQYKSGRGTDRQFYLSAWSGASHTVDRQSQEAVHLNHPFLSVVGCIPPAVLSDLEDDHGREDGFTQRVLFAYPDLVPLRWSEETVSGTTAKNYETLLTTLYEIRERHEQAGTEPRSVPLTDEARKLFIRWHDEHCAQMESRELSPELRGFYAKLKGYCARLALLHVLSRNPRAAYVDREAIGAAADLTDYFKAQAAKVAPLLTHHRSTPHQKCEREIRRTLTQAQGRLLTKREIQRGGNAPATIFNEVFTALRETGDLEEEQNETPTGPKPAYRLAAPDA